MAWEPGDFFDGDTPDTPEWRFAWTGVPHESTSTATRAVQVELVGAGEPKAVQISAPGMAPGAPYRVEGVAGSFTWRVRGGTGVTDGSVLVLADNRSPLNVAFFYRVYEGDVMWRSEDITVPHDGKYVLQSLNGRTSVVANWQDDGLPREPELRSQSFMVAGRVRPVVRLDVAGAGGGSLVFDTTGDETPALADLLGDGRPFVIRTDMTVRDFPPVEILLPVRVSSQLTGARIQDGDTRRWNIQYLFVDDPEMNTPLSTSNWNDFDAVYAALTWDDFDAQWAGLTWDDFDRFDWAGQV